MREWTIRELQGAYRRGETDPVTVCREYLDRIEAIDRNGPGVNAVIETNPDALAVAEETAAAYAEQRDAKGGERRVGLLQGIPVLLKDNIDTGDRMKTTAGSPALVDEPGPEDAFLVRRLREEGAIILGKTNLSEWANFRSSRSNSGWSSRGGQTRNPYALDRTPCGSSSGSGAAVAANLAVVAVGTETDGSVTCPAAHNSLVGLKPTVGLVSRTGIIPISASQDTAGPMARAVEDAAILLQAMIGRDPEDAAYAETEFAPFTGHELEGRRIGVIRGGFLDSHRHRGSLGVFNAAVKAMQDAGAVIVDPVDPPDLEEASGHELTVLLYEFKAGLEAYFARRGGSICTLDDIVRWNRANADATMPIFGQEHMESALECGPLTDEKYLTARSESVRIAGESGLFKLLQDHKLDAVVGATNGPAWLIDHLIGDYYSGGGMSTAPAITGAPHLTLPIGYVHGLPIGISFVGHPGSDGMLLGLGYDLEQRLRARRPPEFRSSAG